MMKTTRAKFIAGGMLIPMLAAAPVLAQGRATLPVGSVILVKTTTELASSTAKPGQAFETVVVDSVLLDNYSVIPAGSRIRGVVTFAKAADRQNSGVIEVNFDRLSLPDGKTFVLDGKLTSTDAAERRQIEADPNARVVLVGGRGGIGAAIAGAGSSKSPASGIFAALGSMLSQAQDVRVPAGTPLAVQLEQRLALTRRSIVRGDEASTIYTAEDRIRSAQQALARGNYYRGSVTGQLDNATRRALFEYQIDKGLVATGNLDGRTAQSLGLSTAAADAPAVAILSAAEASTLRQGAQALIGRYRQDAVIGANGRLDARRTYTQGDLELWFALSAFADNTSLYEQLIRSSGNAEGSGLAGKSLVAAARRVDAAMQQGRTSATTQNAWTNLRAQLAMLDPTYR